MLEQFTKIYNGLIQTSIVLFTIALVWFSFVYYPNIIRKYETAHIPSNPIVPSAAASYNKFPIENTQFRITFEGGSATYYLLIKGDNLGQYLDNKNAAQLALKNALSVDTLCRTNLIIVPSAKLDIPDTHKTIEICRM